MTLDGVMELLKAWWDMAHRETLACVHLPAYKTAQSKFSVELQNVHSCCLSGENLQLLLTHLPEVGLLGSLTSVRQLGCRLQNQNNPKMIAMTGGPH